MKKRKHSRKDDRIRAGLHMEHVARNARYYVQLNDHPNYREFVPEFYDAAGRLYAVARFDMVRTPTPRQLAQQSPNMKLYVKLPPGTTWFTRETMRLPLRLRPLVTHEREHTVFILKHFLQPGHRTGHVTVSRFDWEH